MSSEHFVLPTIDIGRASTDRASEATKIVHVLENTGFAFIENVPGLDIKGLFQAERWFFNKSEGFKGKVMRNLWNPENKNLYRGYFPVVPGEPSHKEAFEFARDVPEGDTSISPTNWFYEKSTWPEEDGSFPFKTFMQEQYEVMHNTCLELLRLCAIGLGIPEDAFTPLFDNKPCSTFRLLHYPTWKDGEMPANVFTEDGKIMTTPEHMDSEFMTLLATFNFRGLEIKQSDGKWVGVKAQPGCLIMNIGVTFSRMLGGRFKATSHRVLDIGEDRFSAAFFLSPRFDADIGINFLSPYTEDDYEHVPEAFGPWLLNRIKHEEKYIEFTGLPEIDF